MITKREFCRMKIDEFKNEWCKQHGIMHIDEITDDMLANFDCVFQSTTLGICLEYLGIINPISHPDLYEYISHRGGIFFNRVLIDEDTDKKYMASLCIRELLDLLPEELPENYKKVWIE